MSGTASLAGPGIIPAVRAVGSHPERDCQDPPREARPMRAAMSVRRPAGGFVASRPLYPKPEPVPGTMPVREYRVCPCGRRFPVYAGLGGRPPRHCFNHRGTNARRRAARSLGHGARD